MSRHGEAKSGAAFGARLKAARLARNWTQPDLVRALYETTDGAVAVQPSEVSRYERGKVKNPSLEFVAAVAKVLERPISYFTSQADPVDRLAAVEAAVSATDERTSQILGLNEKGFREIAQSLEAIRATLGRIEQLVSQQAEPPSGEAARGSGRP